MSGSNHEPESRSADRQVEPPSPSPRRARVVYDSAKKHRWQVLFAAVVIAAGSLAIVWAGRSSRPSKLPDTSSTTSAATVSTATPEPRTAGLIPGSKLGVHEGDLAVVESGTTVADVHITGSLYILGPVAGAGVQNVLVDNVQVDGCVYINSDSKGDFDLPVPSHITLRHLDGHCLFTTGFHDLTLNAVNLHDSLNAPQAQLYDAYNDGSKTHWPASDLVVENSWFHGFKTSTTAGHLANVHLGGVQTATIRNNRFELSVDAATWAETSVTAPFEMDAYAGSGSGIFSSNVTFEHNQLYGDTNFLLYFIATGNSAVRDNQFFSAPRHDYAPLSGVQYFNYPSRNLPGGIYPKFQQSGNTLDGKQITLPGGM